MATTVTRDFEQLCEQEFKFVADECYDGLDEEVAQIKATMHVSSATGQMVKAAVLMRFDKILAAFDDAYLAKWRNDSARALTAEDAEWLNLQVTKQLEPRAMEADGKCNGHLWEPSLFFRRYWEETGVEARQRLAKTRQRIELLNLQKNLSRPNSSLDLPPKPQPIGQSDPFDALKIPRNAKATMLCEELRRCYANVCWNSCGILIGILMERALDAIEPKCQNKRGLSKKLGYCLNESPEFGQSLKDCLRHLTAAKVSRDIVAHDSAILLDRPDIDVVIPYFRHLMNHWASRDSGPLIVSMHRVLP